MRQRNQRGLSLIEVLVAMAILLIAFQAALLLYSASWNAFKKGESAASQQQGVRIAFDKLALDLQMAGFNYNPDGDTTRPDEQIEAAFDTAIVIRGDYDAQDSTLSATPEDTLDGGAFDVVSTGNDEIVAYVLGKDDSSPTDTLTYEADCAEIPRDGAVETVSIPNLALIQNDPPYTLYRVTLSNDESDFGTANFYDTEVLAENIYSMTFRYYDVSGNQINSTFNLGATSDDIGGAEADAADRALIHRVEVDLVGLTPAPDLNWKDPDDNDPDTRSYRKFRLHADITPRNTGKVGVVDLPAF